MFQDEYCVKHFYSFYIPVGAACSTNGDKKNVYRILVGKLEGKRPLGRLRRGWVDNIKTDLRDIDGVVWIGLIWLRIGTSGGLL
jgi:hypothetical protein